MRTAAAPKSDVHLAPETSGIDTGEVLRVTIGCVSAVEHFTHGRIREIIDSHVEGLHDRVAASLYRKSKDIDSSWQSVRDAAREYLGFDLSKSDPYREFAGLIDVRNAAMHGDGRLTRIQQRQLAEVIKRIEGAGFRIDKLRVIADWADSLSVASTCRAMIIAVDGATWTASKGLVSVLPLT